MSATASVPPASVEAAQRAAARSRDIQETSGEKRLRMSYEEFLDWSDEDTHAEWIDGEVIVFMPPTTHHQNVVSFLLTLLRLFTSFLGRGVVLTAPYEMKLWDERPSREPDILFVAKEHAERIDENRLKGPADLVVEVISSSSVTRDRSDKFYEYEEAGVREYWLVDPRPGKQRADFWVLDEDGRYRPVPFDGEGVFRSQVLPGFWLRESWLIEDDTDAFTAFAQIVGLPQQVLDDLRARWQEG